LAVAPPDRRRLVDRIPQHPGRVALRIVDHVAFVGILQPPNALVTLRIGNHITLTGILQPTAGPLVTLRIGEHVTLAGILQPGAGPLVALRIGEHVTLVGIPQPVGPALVALDITDHIAFVAILLLVPPLVALGVGGGAGALVLGDVEVAFGVALGFVALVFVLIAHVSAPRRCRGCPRLIVLSIIVRRNR
jgi:hypothetical protein